MRIQLATWKNQEQQAWKQIWLEDALRQPYRKRLTPEQCREIHEQAHQFFLRAGEEAMERMRQETPPTKETE